MKAKNYTWIQGKPEHCIELPKSVKKALVQRTLKAGKFKPDHKRAKAAQKHLAKLKRQQQED